jgi:small multidrug resistance family-3 protein
VHSGTVPAVLIIRSLVLFALAALAEIGGAWLIWQGWREHRGVWWIAAGIIALGAYGFVATFQPDPNFGRILAAYGGIFVAGSLAWGVVVDKFRPDRWDLLGAAICLIGVAVIMYAPRGHSRLSTAVLLLSGTRREGLGCPRDRWAYGQRCYVWVW